MKSSKIIQQELNEMDIDCNDFHFMRKEMQLQAALQSEEFKNIVLPAFLPIVKECIEKGEESFYITLNTGEKYVYYPTKSRLVPIYEKGKKGKKIYLPAYRFLNYFEFIEHPEKKVKTQPLLNLETKNKPKTIKKLTDDSIMFYGIHQGVKMKDVPKDYLLWLLENDRARPSVRKYIEQNIEKIKLCVNKKDYQLNINLK